ncbi:acyltransferase domain-containing protein, partial [Mycolicibacterium vaccae]
TQAAAPEPTAVTTLVLSGRTPERIASQAAMLADWMAGAGAEIPLAEVAHTLNHHRTRHHKFATVAARDRDQAIAGLQALATGQSAPGVVAAPTASRKPGTVFVYSGQGSQWPGMARQLLADEPAFAAALAEIEPVFVEQVGFSLRDIVVDGAPVSGDARVQPVLMGLQLALTELWRSYGVHPDAVIGHSMGEVTAAVVAGALSLSDGLKVIAARSSIMSRLAGQGAVALVELDSEAAAAFIADYPSVEIAGYVSPRQTVVAGLPEQVDAVIAAVTAQDRFARRVNMEVASHTALMDPVLPDLRDALADVTPRTPNIPFLSTVTEPDGEPTLDADYWVANVRRPVTFSRAVETAAAEIGTFLEVSANPILTYAISDTLDSPAHAAFGTLVRDTDDTLTFHTALNATFTSHPPETPHHGEPHAPLPTTPWHHTHHWAIRKQAASGASAPNPGTVLGAHTDVAGTQPGHLWQARLVPQAKPYPKSHRFAGVEIVPLSVLLQTLSLAAARTGAAAVTDVRFDFPITVDGPRVVQVYSDGDTITISSSTAAEDDAAPQRWVRHATARVAHQVADVPPAAAVPSSAYDPSALAELHSAWGIEGLAYPWTVASHDATSGELSMVVDLRSASLTGLLDAAVNLGRLVDSSSPGLMVPSAAADVRVDQTPVGARGVVVARNRGRDGDDLLVDLAISGEDGTRYAQITGLRYTPVEIESVTASAAADPQRIAHRLDWQPWTPEATGTDTGPVAVVGDGETAAAVRDAVTATGRSLTEVSDARFVVYVASNDAQTDDQDATVRLTTEVAGLVGELAEREPRDPATLWIVTRGVYESATDAALRQSGLWGLAGVVGAEQPQLWGGLVDLPADEVGAAADVFATALATPVKSVAILRDGELRTSVLASLDDAPV